MRGIFKRNAEMFTIDRVASSFAPMFVYAHLCEKRREVLELFINRCHFVMRRTWVGWRSRVKCTSDNVNEPKCVDGVQPCHYIRGRDIMCGGLVR